MLYTPKLEAEIKLKSLKKQIFKVWSCIEEKDAGFAVKTPNEEYIFCVIRVGTSDPTLIVSVYPFPHNAINACVCHGKTSEVWDDIPKMIQEELVFHMDLLT